MLKIFAERLTYDIHSRIKDSLMRSKRAFFFSIRNTCEAFLAGVRPVLLAYIIRFVKRSGVDWTKEDNLLPAREIDLGLLSYKRRSEESSDRSSPAFQRRVSHMFTGICIQVNASVTSYF